MISSFDAIYYFWPQAKMSFAVWAKSIYFYFIDGEFEELEITPVSTPPELPTQMKQQELPAAGS